MWTCPKCHRECDTAFCPDCGYQMPTQYSEADLLTDRLKRLEKKTKNLTVIVAVMSVFLIALIIFSFVKFIHIDQKIGPTEATEEAIITIRGLEETPVAE